MDSYCEQHFDVSKENIQPLASGRNPHLLGLGLQARNDPAVHQELQQHSSRHFEETIRNYSGNDPLENWYQHVVWLEQTNPSNTTEPNNLPEVLECCLMQFENDGRYLNDRRFCRLWMKYIDMLSNPLELYQMMYAKGVCRGCADLYRAWAYYHEVTGNYQEANRVYECGKRELAQPYDELCEAYENFFCAAGQYFLMGPDERRLDDRRRALFTLVPSGKSGQRVDSVRQLATENTVTTGPSAPSTSDRRQNMLPVAIYRDTEETGVVAAGTSAAVPVSIITAAKRQVAPKENLLKAGVWTQMPCVKRRVITATRTTTTPAFQVHEDDDNNCNVMIDQGLKLPKNFPTCTNETYTNWTVSLTIPEPKEDRFVPMYPKSQVYSEPLTEYSLEELRARVYFQGKASCNTANCLSSLWHNSDGSSVGSSPASSSSPPPAPLPNHPVKFAIYEQSNLSVLENQQHQLQQNHQQQGSAMKTLPFKDLNADDLAETGSRGGMDAVAAAAPEMYDLTCNTQVFNFNLTAMKVSTPQSQERRFHVDDEEKSLGVAAVASNGSYRRQLFMDTNPSPTTTPIKPPSIVVIQQSEQEQHQLNSNNCEAPALSTIYEETKSTSSGSSTCTSMVAKQTATNMSAITEEHSSYLAQNLSVNAALRRNLLAGLMMDFDQEGEGEEQAIEIPPIALEAPPASSQEPILNSIPSDPFLPILINRLLAQIGFPGKHTRSYYTIGNIPKLTARKEMFTIGPHRYLVEKQLGKGTFGVVFKGQDVTSGETVALKFQKDANRWEYYICRELQGRLKEHQLRDRFMDIQTAYFSSQSSLFISKYVQNGSLLSVANTVKTKSGRCMRESLCLHFCVEMLRIVRAMHQVRIIHADIKPDNFLVNVVPGAHTVYLQLIDFGNSIDMSLFPVGAAFRRRINTEDFVCCEMLDGRPWNYHHDLFCVAATAHVLLFDRYIQMQKLRDVQMWSIVQRMPRYLRIDVWNQFFSTLLNQQGGAANAAQLQQLLETTLRTHVDYINDLRYLLNLLKNR